MEENWVSECLCGLVTHSYTTNTLSLDHFKQLSFIGNVNLPLGQGLMGWLPPPGKAQLRLEDLTPS